MSPWLLVRGRLPRWWACAKRGREEACWLRTHSLACPDHTLSSSPPWRAVAGVSCQPSFAVRHRHQHLQACASPLCCQSWLQHGGACCQPQSCGSHTAAVSAWFVVPGECAHGKCIALCCCTCLESQAASNKSTQAWASLPERATATCSGV